MQEFEGLGVFYLGRRWDPATREVLDEPLLYEAKDLTTHAVCVGMTGSGKTGLCVSLIEEAALDGVPTIAIDPKGDLGDLLLTFPSLSAEAFGPWVDPGEAARKGQRPEAYAATVAETWRAGLELWGQDGARIERLRHAAEMTIYTPGSDAGASLRLLRSFDAPPVGSGDNGDALRERVMSTASGLLALVGVDADPVRSREHILVSTLLHRAWSAGHDVDLAMLIREIQSPPIERLGVLDVESFFPAADRATLAMRLNGVLASPGFAAWMVGEPLDVQRLLWCEDGRPRVSILNIAHLSDAERMFFVTVLLNEVVAWMRSQPGTPSLRALLYMDEVFGFLPPTANPPSKRPLLTLLKQARACGLGVVLTTQNPVDLDYKALSNAGTWLIGRLQTQRDVERLAAGLQGSGAAVGFDRATLESTLAGLDGRVFLLNNVHDERPELFHTRWAMSYLRGPLTRDQIRTLSAPRRESVAAAVKIAAAGGAAPRGQAAPGPSSRPVVAAGIEERFVSCQREPGPGEKLLYRPGLLAVTRLHFARASDGLDLWRTDHLAGVLDEGGEPLDGLAVHARPFAVQDGPHAGAGFEALPAEAAREASYTSWRRQLGGRLYRTSRLLLWRSRAPKARSEPGESEGAFRGRLVQAAREERDRQVAKLEAGYAPKLARLRERIGTAEARLSREQSQYGQQKLQTAISVGATVLGALFGRRAASMGTVGRATTAARGLGRAGRERDDVARATDELERLRGELERMEGRFREEIDALRAAPDPASFAVERVEIAPRKSDIAVDGPQLAWFPFIVGEAGEAAAFDAPPPRDA